MGPQFPFFFTFAIFKRKKNGFFFKLAELSLTAVHKRPLVVVSRGCCLDEVASIVVEHGLQGAWLWGTGLVAPWQVETSWTRD